MKQIDWLLIGPFLFLSVIGILVVFSASSAFPSGAFGFLFRQSLFALLGILTVAIFDFFIKIRWLASPKLASIALGVTFVLLAFARFISSRSAGTGAHGWIALPFFNIQPAEIFKITVILYLSSLAARRLDKSERRSSKNIPSKTTLPAARRYFGFLPSQIAFVMANLLLVLIMPDLGNSLIAFFLILLIVFASGVHLKWLLLMLLTITALYLLLPTLLNLLPASFLNGNFQARRFLIFLNPWPYSSSYSMQLINSFYAIAHGGLFGVGLGNSIEKMGYLPEANTDFIMSIFTEELGALALFLVVAVLMLMIGRMFYIAFHIKNNFGRLVLYGIGSYFFIQALVNLGGIIGALPMTGVTFPFISYGGSSFLISSISVGIACTVSREYSRQQARQKQTSRAGVVV
ncbi:FtsW-like cell division protein [Oenococcus kitaharae DSM 17330]|uniref:Probable peptidoglycan glycosyltransferase FtsW n=1 Tax=Oenococcus kitaharae DSM 17330 TaxID=1045004 RepID=G9WJS2_9LACO|nr:FtsW-like cell division protein [Oenococcus kitaharae DSM 17330]